MINATSRLMYINAGTAISKKVCYQVYKGTINFLSQVDTWVWTRYVAVDVPLAKLGLTKCPAVRGASEASDRNRDSR